MNDIIKIYKDHLESEKRRLLEVSEEIAPLERKKNRIEQNIKALEHLIGSQKETGENESLTGSLVGMSGYEGYKKLIKNSYINVPFREREIRDHTNKEGLRIKGKPIARPYSRTIIRDMLENGFLEKIDRGLFCLKKQEKETEPIRRIRMD